MNLIDKYIAEVGKHLPRRQRADIEAEIRSTLMDMLEERKQAETASEAEVVALLKEYGEPRKVAESYVGPRYLIGPKLYPLFELVTKIVLTVIFAIALAGLALSLSRSSLMGLEFLQRVGESALNLLGSLIAIFGNIVLVFAILERTLSAKDMEDESEEWDPAKLESEPDPDEVKIGDQIWNILFMVLFLIIFNLNANPDAWYIRENDWNFLSLRFTDAFLSYLPWINTLAALEIAMGIYMIRQQIWTTATRIVNIALQLAWIALGVVMLRGPNLIESATGFSRLGNLMASVTLTIIIIVSCIEVAQMVYRLMKTRPALPYPMVK